MRDRTTRVGNLTLLHFLDRPHRRRAPALHSLCSGRAELANSMELGAWGMSEAWANTQMTGQTSAWLVCWQLSSIASLLRCFFDSQRAGVRHLLLHVLDEHGQEAARHVTDSGLLCLLCWPAATGGAAAASTWQGV